VVEFCEHSSKPLGSIRQQPEVCQEGLCPMEFVSIPVYGAQYVPDTLSCKVQIH
jgi:hypothetical protein